jgi:hypothetical protein
LYTFITPWLRLSHCYITPLQAFYSRERQQQMSEALRVLDEDAAGNVLFAGGVL